MLTKNHPLYNDFISLSCRLSPENLHCDGEVSYAEAMRRKKRIMSEWAALEKKAGFKITPDEVEMMLIEDFRR